MSELAVVAPLPEASASGSAPCQGTPNKRCSAGQDMFSTLGAHLCMEQSTITYSRAAQLVLSGGAFEARTWLRKPLRTGESEADETAMAALRWRVKWLDLSIAVPRYLELSVTEFETHIQTMRAGGDKAASKDLPRWPTTYSRWERIPKYWRAEIVLEVTSGFGMTLTRMTALDARNTYAICEMFDFIIGVYGKLKLHPLLREKKVVVDVVQRRISTLGRCSESWIKALTKNVQEPLNVYWCARGAGCYWLEKRPHGDGLRLSSLQQLPRGAVALRVASVFVSAWHVERVVDNSLTRAGVGQSFVLAWRWWRRRRWW
jgi:hypothetical protein